MIKNTRKKSLSELEKKLKVSFNDIVLLDQSLTHKSYVYEKKLEEFSDNERLEFLGDAVLKLIISNYLIQKYPNKDEGELTRIRAIIVSDNNLAKVAEKLYLGKYLQLSENERKTGGRKRKSNIANALEAIFGASFLDGGISAAEKVIISLLENHIEDLVVSEEIIDQKSTLQELVQSRKWDLPVYKVIKEVGPDHKKKFYIEVEIKADDSSSWIGKGEGNTKKEAEQMAARDVLGKAKYNVLP